MRIGTFQRILQDESGATGIEYGIIASVMSLAAVVAYDTIGVHVEALFEHTSDIMKVASDNLNN